MLQWQDYDTIYNTVSNWVKDTEVKVRNETGLQRDLQAKQRQIEQFEVWTIMMIRTLPYGCGTGYRVLSTINN